MHKILVTGANRGIGLELCRQLVAGGNEVIAVCRSSSDDLRELDLRVIDGIDVSSGASITELSCQLAGEQLDWLLNNAGILSVESLADLDFEAIQRQFRVNSLGPLRVSSGLLPNLSTGSKIGIVTSRMGSIDDNSSGGLLWLPHVKSSGEHGRCMPGAGSA